jgi:3'-5' exoribonuclease 1
MYRNYLKIKSTTLNAMDDSARYICCIDLEATCWNTAEHKGENEIIEIGITLITPTRELGWKGGWFVRPVRNPVLSDFCKELTHITQAEVESAAPFPEVLALFEQTMLSETGLPLSEQLFCSWGNYDRSQFKKDCKFHQTPYPFKTHWNFKADYLRQHALTSCSLSTAITNNNLTFVGNLHRGVDDAYNLRG